MGRTAMMGVGKSFNAASLIIGSVGLLTLCLPFVAMAELPPMTDVAFAPDGSSVVAVSQAGLQVFSWPALQLQKTIELPMANVSCVQFSPQGNRLAVGGGDPSETGVVHVMAWPDLRSVQEIDGHLDCVLAVVWQNEQQLVSAGMDRDIKYWNVATTGHASRILKGHSRPITSLVPLPDEKTLVSAGLDQSVRVWEVATGKLLRSLSQHTKPIHDVALRPTQEGLAMVASAASDRTIRFWQPTIGRLVRYVRLDAEPLSIAWLNDGSRLIAACVDGQVQLIDPENVKVLQTVPVIDGWAYAVAVDPAGLGIVVGGTNGQLRRLEFDNARGVLSEGE